MRIVRVLALSIAASLAMGGCNGSESTHNGGVAPVVTPPAEDPFAHYPSAAEGDAASLEIDESISPDAAAIDARAPQLEIRSVTLDPERAGWQPRVVRGWFDQGRLVRLSVTEPTTGGRMSGESVWYLSDAEPFLVRTPDAIYVLDDAGRIERSLELDGTPVPTEDASSQERGRSLEAAFQRWNDSLIKSPPDP